ncbi:hypothetical protein HYW46_03710 [Candidatus Daviesbacteria bacterium]|nr:hypothetical protein [Candidatus Daviesbacteria bacterium]
MVKKLLLAQSGIAHLILLLVAVIFISALFLLITSGIIKNPTKLITDKVQQNTKEPTVKLQTAYKNPFDKSSQYVNPFSAYKNPFDTIK